MNCVEYNVMWCLQPEQGSGRADFKILSGHIPRGTEENGRQQSMPLTAWTASAVYATRKIIYSVHKCPALHFHQNSNESRTFPFQYYPYLHLGIPSGAARSGYENETQRILKKWKIKFCICQKKTFVFHTAALGWDRDYDLDTFSWLEDYTALSLAVYFERTFPLRPLPEGHMVTIRVINESEKCPRSMLVYST
jgi:hypothetical protein